MSSRCLIRLRWDYPWRYDLAFPEGTKRSVASVIELSSRAICFQDPSRPVRFVIGREKKQSTSHTYVGAAEREFKFFRKINAPSSRRVKLQKFRTLGSLRRTRVGPIHLHYKKARGL